MSEFDTGCWVNPGTLYVVATPLGNLSDLSPRARSILRDVDLIACEDTRHSGKLLGYFGIATARQSLHAHNETVRVPALIGKLEQGASIALISDAGTPLVSDPGFELVRAAKAAGIPVSPVPGPTAMIAALSASGLPADRFAFEGFLPAKSAARRERLDALREASHTLIFYEAPHRLAGMVNDLTKVLGGERHAVIAAELTKLHERFFDGPLRELAAQLQSGELVTRGEWVVLVEGASRDVGGEADQAEVAGLIEALLEEGVPPKAVVKAMVKATGQPRNRLYEQVMQARDHLSGK